MTVLSSFAIPLMIGLIIFAGLYRGVPVYDVFLKGSADSLKATVKIIPSIIALVTAISMLQASGFLGLVCHALSPVAKFFSFPAEALPLAVLRPVSGSGSTALLQNILNSSGPDSAAGRVASVICGAGETTFYTMSIYFAATRVQNTRHTLRCSLIADITCIIAGALSVHLFLT